MDAYHPDFHDTMAIDLRIRKITRALGCSFKTYEEEERFYQEIAKEAGLQGWKVDRLLYEYTDHFLADTSASEGPVICQGREHEEQHRKVLYLPEDRASSRFRRGLGCWLQAARR